MTILSLSHGGEIDVLALIAYINGTGRNYIIQGQQNSTRANHTKPDSLDFWIRSHGADKEDTKQADKAVLDALLKTNLFVIDDALICPTSGKRCKGLRLL